jgi:ubiquinol-cytochrome c reductase cytochrome b subunit
VNGSSRGPTMAYLLKMQARDIADRYRIAKVARSAMRKVFPDHWSFFLGELALYSFVILIITGTWLALFFRPSLALVQYHGSYKLLDGLSMSEAYDSTLRISFDVRAGLLVRQLHHWAALIFIASISFHMVRIFMTGAFRRPREMNWIIGVTLLGLAVLEGFLGYSLPDDDLSGTGVRIAASVIESIPLIGTYLLFFFFGGQYPGSVWVHRFYILHVFVVPALLAALIGAHLLIIWHQGHTQWPGKRQRENNEVGDPMYPYFMAKTGALFFFVFGVISVLSAYFQINPVWFYGPYDPVKVQAGSQPDWYIGYLEGTLRMMPGVVTNIGGHTFVWNVFIPAVLFPALFFMIAMAYPFIEEWITGDIRHHQILDRPRNMPTRTAFGVAVIAIGGDILAAGADDLISWKLNIPLFAVVWFFRAGFFVFPVVLFFVTRRICLALQRSEARRLAGGATFGIARDPSGAYTPVTEPISEEERAMKEVHRPAHLIAPVPRHVLPMPTPERVTAYLRARLNHAYTRTRLETKYGVGRIEEAVAERELGAKGPITHPDAPELNGGKGPGRPAGLGWPGEPAEPVGHGGPTGVMGPAGRGRRGGSAEPGGQGGQERGGQEEEER